MHGKTLGRGGYAPGRATDLAGQVFGGALPASRELTAIRMESSSREYSICSVGSWPRKDPANCSFLFVIAIASGSFLRRKPLCLLGALPGLCSGFARTGGQDRFP